MKTLVFTSNKGGVGTTNVACVTAVLVSQMGLRVLLVDTQDNADCYSWFAASNPTAKNELSWATEDIWLAHVNNINQLDNLPLEAVDVVIVDGGQDNIRRKDTTKIKVVTNNYMALKNTCNRNYDQYVCTFNEGHALIKSDVENVMKKKLHAFVECSPSVARAIDAGTIKDRLPSLDEFHELREWVKGLVATSETIS